MKYLLLCLLFLGCSKTENTSECSQNSVTDVRIVYIDKSLIGKCVSVDVFYENSNGLKRYYKIVRTDLGGYIVKLLYIQEDMKGNDILVLSSSEISLARNEHIAKVYDCTLKNLKKVLEKDK